MNRNSTDFPIYLKKFANEIQDTYTKLSSETDLLDNNKTILKYHQYVVLRYVLQNTNQRGLLIFHGMGTGKTLLAVAIAEECRKHGCLYSKTGNGDTPRKIIVLAAKSLEANFKQTLKKYNPKLNETSPEAWPVLDKYAFVSLNAGNMYEQTKRAGIESEIDLAFERRLGEFTRTQKHFLENSLLIVDEAHNLFNAICNGSKNAMNLYDAIMGTKNIKILFLTGSPIINTPFELVPCFNMLTAQGIPPPSRGLGKGFTDNYKKPALRRLASDVQPLFTEYRHEFEEYFIKNNRIKNKDFLQNRIVGLVSYYGDFLQETTTTKSTQKEHFPEQKLIKLEIVHMSPYQYEAYDLSRESERDEHTYGKSGTDKRFSEKGTMTSTYRIKSRQLSNFAFPEHAREEIRGKTTSIKKIKHIKHLSHLTAEDLDNLDIYSPKMKCLMENITKESFPQLIYSEFVSGEGLAIIRLLLEKQGYANWENIHETADTADALEIQEFKRPNSVYALISGDVEMNSRAAILEEFNSSENLHGERIKLLLISKTGAEGLDCKYIRAVHILEPFWNFIRIEQIIARAVRYKSHDDLPEEERSVQPYIYLSTYPQDTKLVSSSEKPKEKETEVKKETISMYDALLKQIPHDSAKLIDNGKQLEFTTDIEMFKKSIENKLLITEFLYALIEASCDCFAHYDKLDANVQEKIKCKMCSPTHVPLYTDLLARDIRMPNPCIEPKEEEIAVKEIIIDNDKKFYYREIPLKNNVDVANIEIYEYNEGPGIYTLMQRTHPYYADLIEAIHRK